MPLHSPEGNGILLGMSDHRKTLFAHLGRYNRRANNELLGVVAGLTDRALRRDTGSWFTSIYGILNHIIVADLYWLNRFKPISPDSRVLADPKLSPPNLSWSHDLCEDLAALRQSRGFVDERIIDWFEECPEDRYDARFQYLDSRGTTRDAVAANAFEFLFVHQIHHRGQITQVLDALGVPNNIADNGAFLEGAAG